MDNLVGMKIAGRYNIKELIGMGGMAQVYKAECEMLKRNVAIKVLLENLRDDEETVKNFTREAQAAARLSHNNIVSVFDVGEDDGLNYMVMELVDGVTLKKYIEENGPFPWQEACNFCIQIGAALSEAHAHDVIHRDIKPQNILITKDKILKVTDFGIAKAVGTNTVTMGNNSAMGTVHYISPEQARGGYTDERSDIYSLGAVLYELLTGKVPFDGETAISVALMHIEKPVPDVLKENPDVPRAFRKIIEKAMAKEQFARYSTVEEFIEDLRTVLAGEYVIEEQEAEDLGETRIRKFDEEEFERERKRRAQENSEYEDEEEDYSKKPSKKPSKKKKVKTEEEKKADRSATILALLTVFLLIAIGVCVYAIFKPVTQVAVPSVVGMTEEEAEKALKDEGLKMNVQYLVSDEGEDGKVLSQKPEAGESVKENSSVMITIDIGDETESVFVPSVTGKTEEEAKSMLIDKELLYQVEEIESDEAKGTVVSQSPDSGEQVGKNSYVLIVVSSGKKGKNEDEKKEDVAVPRVISFSLSDARDILEAKGLGLGSVDYEESTEARGTVISQNPSSEKTVASGTKVNLVISSGTTSASNPSNENNSNTSAGNSGSGNEVSEGKGSTKTYSLKVPESDDPEKNVEVEVKANGQPIYGKTHSPGETIKIEITQVGMVKLEAYVDGVLVNSQTVDFG